MNVIGVASQHLNWLTVRQAVTATNIANTDTPGFKAQQITAFQDTLKNSGQTLGVTHAKHMRAAIAASGGAEIRPQNNAEPTLSGNDVIIEKELRTLGENARQHAFDIGMLRTFHRLILTSIKS
jgi:flagellar basal-body rod protein FlgB